MIHRSQPVNAEQRFALVTGACGGIGRAIVEVLGAAGWRVIATDNHDAELGGEKAYICADLAQIAAGGEARRDFARLVRARTAGHLHLLVNNAAHQVVKPIDRITAADWAETMAVNVTAPYVLTQEFLPELEASRGGIINISSIHANLTKPGFTAYATSKGALATMTRAMAVELGPRGVRVNAILPAATNTPMLRAGFAENPAGLAELAAMHPIGRIASVEEIAQFVAYLASPAAGFIHGATLGIDGGIAARLHDPV